MRFGTVGVERRNDAILKRHADPEAVVDSDLLRLLVQLLRPNQVDGYARRGASVKFTIGPPLHRIRPAVAQVAEQPLLTWEDRPPPAFVEGRLNLADVPFFARRDRITDERFEYTPGAVDVSTIAVGQRRAMPIVQDEN